MIDYYRTQLWCRDPRTPVKDQLEHPDRKTIPPHLLAPLRAASLFTAVA